MNDNKIALRILSALILLAAIAGIGFLAYQAGLAQGSPVTVQVPAGQAVPAPYPYYGMPFRPWGPWGGAFGCFGPLLVLFLVFLALRAFRFAFWGPRWGWGHHHGPWSRHWDNGVPPMFEEWHKRAHGESTDDKKE